MSKLEATPGPWEVIEYNQGKERQFIIKEAGDTTRPYNGWKLAIIPVRKSWETEDRANARLLAAAPDMYEAGEPVVAKLERQEQRLVSRYSKLGSDDEPLEITFGEARALRAALSLARGEGREE